jgi:hypothetical protein
MLRAFLHRILGQTGPVETRRRIDVCPPSLLPAGALAAVGWRAGWSDWLGTGGFGGAGGQQRRARGSAGRGPGADPRLHAVRDEFLATLHDIRTQEVALLVHRIGVARSLRELWHLRPQVFRLVALRFSEAEAQCRLDRLNRHFPTRSPRSGFAPL